MENALRIGASKRIRAGLLAPELANGIARLKGAASKSLRLGNWLTAKRAQALLSGLAATTNKGFETAPSSVSCLGCGLRLLRSGGAPLSTSSSVMAAGASWISLGSMAGSER
jgi:hypothetical protein